MRTGLAIALMLLLAACAKQGELRTRFQAVEAAQAHLRAAGIDEQAIDSRDAGDRWVVITRSPKSANFGHVVTLERATGKTLKVETYRSVQIGR